MKDNPFSYKRQKLNNCPFNMCFHQILTQSSPDTDHKKEKCIMMCIVFLYFYFGKLYFLSKHVL